VTDALNSATFYASIFGGHAGSVAGQLIDLAMAHPIITFQILALLSIMMHRRGSQI
jgi:membrane protein implicated in regulation of membrane protease activity